MLRRRFSNPPTLYPHRKATSVKSSRIAGPITIISFFLPILSRLRPGLNISRLSISRAGSDDQIKARKATQYPDSSSCSSWWRKLGRKRASSGMKAGVPVLSGPPTGAARSKSIKITERDRSLEEILTLFQERSRWTNPFSATAAMTSYKLCHPRRSSIGVLRSLEACGICTVIVCRRWRICRLGAGDCMALPGVWFAKTSAGDPFGSEIGVLVNGHRLGVLGGSYGRYI